MKRYVEVQVRVILPWHNTPIEKWIKIDAPQAESLHPLPRCRELPFAIVDREVSARQKIDRRRLIKSISNALTSAIAEAIYSRDTKDGYSPEE